jgi:AcrR family transcriptional regulator
MEQEITQKRRGRPPAFDAESALQKAMVTFWTHGYEGTSMSTLAEALGMNKASIYAAFGSKDELFHKAVLRYTEGPASFVAESLKEPTAAKVIEKFLSTAARVLTDPAQPRGCMITLSSIVGSHEAKHIQEALAKMRADLEQSFYQRFKAARKEGDLSKKTDVAALAKLVVTVHQGMAIQAASGATEEELLGVAHLFIEQMQRKK